MFKVNRGKTLWGECCPASIYSELVRFSHYGSEEFGAPLIFWVLNKLPCFSRDVFKIAQTSLFLFLFWNFTCHTQPQRKTELCSFWNWSQQGSRLTCEKLGIKNTRQPVRNYPSYLEKHTDTTREKNVCLGVLRQGEWTLVAASKVTFVCS